MAMDLDGNVYLTGPGSENYAASGVDYVTIKYFVNTYEPVMLSHEGYDGPGLGTDQSCGFAAWRDPVTGRYFIFRDPVTNEDYVTVTGNSTRQKTGVPTFEFATVSYNGALSQRWVQRFYQ